MSKRANLERGRIPTYIPGVGVNPVCPHCEADIEGVYHQELEMSLGKGYMWFFTKCRKVLGVSHRKGFWMG